MSPFVRRTEAIGLRRVPSSLFQVECLINRPVKIEQKMTGKAANVMKHFEAAFRSAAGVKV